MATERYQSDPETENFIKNPPQIILVFDNYRGPQKEDVAQTTMQVRAAIAALIYHSQIYSDENRPLVCSFSGKHEPYQKPGSDRIAHYLRGFGIPQEKILTRTNTITTTTDLMQLHVLTNAHGLQNAAIITTNDHMARTKREIENHFNRKRNHGKSLNIEVISPSSKTLDLLQLPDNLGANLTIEIETSVELGRIKQLDGGLMERLATVVSYISEHRIRIAIQQKAQQIIYPYIPDDLSRIYKIAKFMHQYRKKTL